METLMVSCKSVAQIPTLPKQETPFKNSSRRINPTVTYSPKPLISDSELRLNHLSRTGQLKEAVIVLDAIAKDGHKVTPNTYISLLQSCIDFNSIEHGRLLHTRIGLVHHHDPFVDNKLVSMYAKCGSLVEARRVFEEMRERNLFAWSSMIGGYTREQRWREIVQLFSWMMTEGVTPDEFLLPKVLQACGNVEDVQTGKLIHSFMVRSGLNSSIQVNNSVVSMYAKCGKLSCARSYFEKMDEKNNVTWNSIISGYCHTGNNAEALRLIEKMHVEGPKPDLITWNILIASYNQSGNCDIAMEQMKKMASHGIAPDVFTWTSMISGCAQNMRRTQALELFREMILAGVQPNGVTIASAVSACASLKALEQGKELHSLGVKLGSMGDVLLGNSLIEMYSKCGEIEAAMRIFDAIPERDVVTWNSMIGGFTQAGYFGKAYDLFLRMQDSSVKPNVITWNVMISAYIQTGDEDRAMDLFQRMETDGITKRSTASWNLLITGFLHNGQMNKAFAVFRQMQSCSIRPNSITMLCILPACANLVSLQKVKEIHCFAVRGRLELEPSVCNKLIDAYAKSGNMSSARAIFEKLSVKDVTSWNTMIAGYVFHGFPNIALDLFECMKLEGPKPNRGTFASVILAYSLAGMVNEGYSAFSSMTSDYQISPGSEHYSAMVYLLGRSNRLKEAASFIEETSVQQNSAVLNSLFTASRMHGNIELAVHAAESLFQIEPRNAIVYRLLLQLYALNGQSIEAFRLREPRKHNGIDNYIGCSWTEYRNKVHTFVTGDMRNSEHIYAQVASILEEIETVLPDSLETQLCVSEEEKEETCGIHSEKLAISFALIASSYSSRCIRIIKNFRMCRDCHNTAKFVSLKYGREVYLYDTKCLHHFKNGRCSCRDYW